MSKSTDIGGNERQSAGKNLPEAQLLAYLEGRLQGDELHEVEQWIATESMESDALEGLRDLPAKDAAEITQQLNRYLQQSLPKKRRRRRGMQAQKWAWMAIVLILLLAIAGFAVIWVIKR